MYSHIILYGSPPASPGPPQISISIFSMITGIEVTI